MIKKIATAASAALMLASAFGAAQANSAQSLSLSNSEAVRAATVADESNEAEGSTGIIIGVVAAVAVIGGIIIIADDSN